jgi:hypothetical protein
MPARTRAALDELAEIAAGNPGHCSWREATYDGIRYFHDPSRAAAPQRHRAGWLKPAPRGRHGAGVRSRECS